MDINMLHRHCDLMLKRLLKGGATDEQLSHDLRLSGKEVRAALLYLERQNCVQTKNNEHFIRPEGRAFISSSSFTGLPDLGDKSIKAHRIVDENGKLIFLALKNEGHVWPNERIMSNTKRPNPFSRFVTGINASGTDAPHSGEVALNINPRKFALTLLAIVGALFLLSLTAVVLKFILLKNDFFSNALEYFFDLSLEGNVPTIFSSIILFMAAALLFAIFKTKQTLFATRYMTNCWLILSAIFVFLCIDESSRIHEQFSNLTKITGEQSGYLHNSWIIPYAIFSLAAGVYFFRFAISLPNRTRTIFLISGVMYVGSALGFEVFEGRLTYIFHGNNLYDKLLCSIEELLEMSSIVLFIYGLLEYLLRHNIQFNNRGNNNDASLS